MLFHGAGSANLGGAQLLQAEVKMPPGAVVVTNSRGLGWNGVVFHEEKGNPIIVG